MGWWKCSSNINLLDVCSELKKTSGRGDSKSCERMFVFYCTLSESSNGIIFYTPNSLQIFTQSTQTQCKIVWDICIKHNVLRKDGNGYSASEWMHEQGLLPDEEQKRINRDKQTAEIKEQVRPNVRLSRSELDALRKDYSDEKVAQILDTLSKYKTEKGKHYASDYDAIRRWVCRAVEKSATINQPEKFDEENFTSPFPDWIYGNKEEGHDKG